MKLHISFYLLFCFAMTSAVTGQEGQKSASVAGNEQVEAIMKSFSALGVQADDSLPTSPQEALAAFDVQAGFAMDLVANEPEVSQPLFLSWDSRGRMWVVQYRQYQFPAGLKIIRYDQYLRAVFDRVPEPPPRGVPGLDKITVHEDTDGDGLYDTSKDVLTGLNIASAVQTGRGGIWVLNPPYLLFYPDADCDDVPDSEPEVVLSGFGLHDTHSVANSLLWGPDGWLYGANGSTTTGTISSSVTKGVSFEGQCIWRYHPESREFEIYAEGGGNTFSLDIDSAGRVFSGTNGGNTRGYYYPQGSYSEKNWGKHGPLTNPYAFGYFRAMKLKGDTRRFAQAFLVYEGGLFPRPFDGSVIASNSLHNLVWNSKLIQEGSTYQTEDQENLLSSSDRWFRPVYNGVGPDGAVYIADWYDTRLSHVSPVDDWHKESGRIYRVRPTQSYPKYSEGDLSKLPAKELIDKFKHANKWVRQRAVLELGWRGDNTCVPELVENVNQDASLESLWALNLLNGLTSERAGKWLEHTDLDIRRWVVRLLGDRHESHGKVVELARTETDVQVRSQLASTAKRVDAKTGLAMLRYLVMQDEDVRDPHLPLLYWWVLEAHADSWPDVELLLDQPDFWESSLAQEHLLGRLVQRFASRGTAEDLNRCDTIVERAPNEKMQDVLIASLNKAFQGRAIPSLPPQLAAALVHYQSTRGEAGLVLGLKSGQANAVKLALTAIASSETELGIRIELVRALSEIRDPAAVAPLLRLATGRAGDDPSLQRAAIVSLSSYDDDTIPDQLVKAFYSSISGEYQLRETACRTLASRSSWALILLKEINEWRLKATDVPTDVIQLLRTYEEPTVISQVEQAFGKPFEMLSPEKLATINRLTTLLAGSLGAQSSGDLESGKALFMKRCGVCHRLFGEGEAIGPPLDAYQRGDVKFWLAGIVEPSLEIREGYQSYAAITDDGRVVTGMIVSQDPNIVVLRTADNRTESLPRNQLETLKAIPTSLMPEDLLKELSDDQIRDLFAYLSQGAH